MLLEDYFDFIGNDDIRIKGTRVGIEHVLDEYINFGKSPEAIAEQFLTITLEQVYATILYYFHNQEIVAKYISDWIEHTNQVQQKYDENPPEFVVRLLKLKEKREATKVTQ
ncbi:MAG: DUF433 domain-containing protein [Symploca sp. SIO3E6]|nr:DUF433 domain-containing protein [Caldora sp. SIO3E6]